ncbi:ABC-2 transporter permease [Intestinimonas sp.]|uniref:ABC-2 transporter permease n=1 Tax=Intestinimonas sp. TaxID=1965293 RepID=UPI00262906F2|nr:ABC-2 transporter permease [Intestinimonas sp.]
MTGLLKKDLYLSANMFRSYAAVAAIFSVLTAFHIFDISFFVSYVSVMCIMIPVNLFAYDEQARWDKYGAAFPCGRSGMVLARYLFTLLICCGSLLFSLLLQAAVAWATGVQGVDRLELLLSGLLPAAYGCFMNALLLPLLYKFGSQKGRIYLLMVMGLGVGLIFATMAILKELNFSVSQFSLSLLALPPLGLLTLIPSYFLSRRIFFHKDL